MDNAILIGVFIGVLIGIAMIVLPEYFAAIKANARPPTGNEDE